MSVVYTDTIRAERLALLISEIGPSARLRIYAGTRPATPSTAVTTQHLLAEAVGGSPFGTVTGTVLTASAMLGATVYGGVSNETPTWYRLFKADGATVIADGSVGVANADLVVSFGTVSSGDSIAITNFVVNASGSSLPTVLTLNGAAGAGTVGTPYSAPFVASGGVSPYTYSSTGTLPAGLSLNATTGVLSGTPTTAGSSTFVIQVTDLLLATASSTQTIVISAVAALSISGTAGPGTVGSTYSASFAATGGTSPYTYSVFSGALPAGLTLNTASGLVSGTPTTAATSTFVVRATDAVAATANSASQSVVIAASASALAISGTAPAGTVGTAYSYTFTGTGGTAPRTFAVFSGTLPAGLTLASTGVLSGTPTAAATSTFVVRLTDAASATADSVSQSVVISAAGLDTRPGFFLGPIGSTPAAIVAGRTDLASSTNGGKTGGPATFTTTAGQYVFFAVATAAGTPVFHDNNFNFNGGFSSFGTVTDGNGTAWTTYKSDNANAYPSSAGGGSVTLQ